MRAGAAHIAAPDPHGRGIERAMLRRSWTPGRLQRDDRERPRTATRSTIPSKRPRFAGARHRSARPVNRSRALGHHCWAPPRLKPSGLLLAGRHGQVPATLGLEERDPACDLDCVQGAPRALRPRLSLSTSLGFGGCNAALVIESA